MAKANIQTRERANGGTAYRVMFRIDGKQVGETFDTLEAAETFRDWVEKFGGREARELRYQRSGQHKATITVAQQCREHVDNLSGITAGTRQRYLSIIDNAIEPTKLGKLPISAVKKQNITAWIRDQETTVAGKTIKNRHALLSAAFSTAIEDGLIEANPCARARIGRTEGVSPTFLTRDEFAILLAHMPQRWKAFTIAMVGTGLRFGETSALKVGDVHLDDTQPVLRVERSWKYVNGSRVELGPPKTKKGRRTVSLSPSLVDVLRPLVSGRASGEFVFTTAGGQPVRNVDYREDGWLRAIKAATATHDKEGAKIPADHRLTKAPRIHDLRHTHASWLLADGVSLTDVQYRLGHESIKTTSDTYAHLLPDAGVRAAHSVELALAQVLPELEESGTEADLKERPQI